MEGTFNRISLTLLTLQVLENIRLPLISPYYLHDVIEALDVVKENQGCQKLISEAKDYLLLKDRRSELYCMRARPRRSSGICTGTKTDTPWTHTCVLSRVFPAIRPLTYKHIRPSKFL